MGETITLDEAVRRTSYLYANTDCPVIREICEIFLVYFMRRCHAPKP